MYTLIRTDVLVNKKRTKVRICKGNSMTAPLTKRQRSVYEFIESYIHEKGFGPTVREIAEAVNLSSPCLLYTSRCV